MSTSLPLAGVRVLDFSSMVPGPLASLILAEAGADVVKVERPGVGDDMREMAPFDFESLNRGKRSVSVDLKDPGAASILEPMIEQADVVIEQFRPGVMDRLGLGYERARSLNPRVVYCSITGYGQTGPLAAKAGHDLNYVADSGLLASARRAEPGGAPHLPPTFIADIGGGTYPALVNILLALRTVDSTGRGTHLDIAMTENLFLWQWWVRAQVDLEGRSSDPGTMHPAGGSPRYALYAAADGAVIVVAALEHRFWHQLCEALSVPAPLRLASADTATVQAHLADVFAQQPGEHWRSTFDGVDACVSIMTTPDEAFAHPHWAVRETFAETASTAGRTFAAITSPVHASFRRTDERSAPALGSSEPTFLSGDDDETTPSGNGGDR